MADDGLLVNFAINDSLPTFTPRFKGGNWRERVRLKRRAVSGGQRQTEDGQQNESRDQINPNRVTLPERRHDDPSNPRPVKRQRQNPPERNTEEAAGPRKYDANVKRPEGRQSNGPKEVISSLFSYNPQPINPVQKDGGQPQTAPVQPSNAPLASELDTFTSLGLSTTLATHLLTKMDLKAPTAIQKSAVTQMLEENSDTFIQSETGSGKTLAYLLPLVQRIMTMSETNNPQKNHPEIDPALHRDSGLFAIILAPTRELCKQIAVVLERLLGCAHYIVAGTVIGGEKKKSEKARLRKGINILIATPGRLVDHLEHTKALDVGSVRWLILDEGDRLMDLGFEQDISQIVKSLDEKHIRSARPGLPAKRCTVLCSATLKMSVQKLGEISLKNAVHIKNTTDDHQYEVSTESSAVDTAFLAPAQLKQSFVVVASKLRLVTLSALLKRTFARKGSVMKAIVFVSCADSVDFHFKVLSHNETSEMTNGTNTTKSTEASPLESESSSSTLSSTLSSPENPISLFKLHGSLPQATRTSIVKQFGTTTKPALLLATDVASRGLDLPNLDLVIEYDPAFSSDDHLHRIGRTARVGRDGRAMIFLLPGKEENYVEILHRSFKPTDDFGSVSNDPTTKTFSKSKNVTQQSSTDILRKGFSPASGIVGHSSAQNYETQATEYQLVIERWIASDPKMKDVAKKAFQSHVRAYATHIANERKYFDIKDLHLGHLAKSFGLRDAPGRIHVVGMGRDQGSSGRGEKRRFKVGEGSGNGRGSETVNNAAMAAAMSSATRKNDAAIDRTTDESEAAKKMREKVRSQQKMMRVMKGTGADEFNIA